MLEGGNRNLYLGELGCGHMDRMLRRVVLSGVIEDEADVGYKRRSVMILHAVQSLRHGPVIPRFSHTCRDVIQVSTQRCTHDNSGNKRTEGIRAGRASQFLRKIEGVHESTKDTCKCGRIFEGTISDTRLTPNP